MEFALLFVFATITADFVVFAGILDGDVKTSDTAIVRRIKGTFSFHQATKTCVGPTWTLAQFYDEDTKWAVHRYITSAGYKVPDNKPYNHGFWIGLSNYGGYWKYTDGTIHEFADWVARPVGGLVAFMNPKFSPKLLHTSSYGHGKYLLCTAKVPHPKPVLNSRGKCDDYITVEWNNDYIYYPELPYRIVATDLDSSSPDPPVIYTYRAKGSHYKQKIFQEKLRGLKKYKKYKIKVMRCLTLCCCSVDAQEASTFYEGGPVAVPTAGMKHFPKEDKCEVTWSLPNSQPAKDIEGFKVTIEGKPSFSSTFVDEDTFVERNIVTKNPSLKKHGFKTSPNRKYRAFVQTKSCGRFSEKVEATGKCITESAVPKFLPNPGLMFTNGNIQLRVFLPKEDYGEISCIFIILKPSSERPLSTTQRPYTVEKLKKATQNVPALYQEIIIAALPRRSFIREYIDFDLEKGSEGACNIQQDGNPVNEYRARNSELNRKWYYSIYIVSSTPYYGSPMLKRSGSTILFALNPAAKSSPRSEEQPTSDSSGNDSFFAKLKRFKSCGTIFIILVAVFGVLLIAEVGGILAIWWRKDSTKDESGEEYGKYEKKHDRKHRKKKHR